MPRGSFNFMEVHAEKFILGAAGAFMLAMVWMYLLNTPNLVEFNGQKVSSRELDEKIEEQARQLETRIRNATPESVSIPAYGKDLDREHQSGVLAPRADGAPAIPASLRLASTFGKTISVPGLEEETEAAGQIAVVKPLPPTKPVLITGRSVAARRPIASGIQSAAPTPPDAKPEAPSEFPWVSIAAYFDKDAQRNEMTNARYANYRTKVYVAGVDVQRQEILANGEYSDWKDVKPGKASVPISIPQPLFDDQTGQMLNKADVTAAFSQVQQSQQMIIQPPFYSVDVGSEWDVPPLEGFGDDEASTDGVDALGVKDSKLAELLKKLRDERRKHKAEQRKGGGGGGGGGESIRGGFGESVRGGFNEGMVMRTPTGGGGGGDPKSAAKKAAQETLKIARSEMVKKEYDKARNTVSSIINNLDIEGGILTQAAKLYVEAERHLEKQAAKGGAPTGPVGDFPRGMPMGEGGGRMPMGEFGGRMPMGEIGGRMPMGEGSRFSPGPTATALELVTHPDKPNQPAVWFHDDSVEAGKTYRYRMRVNLWNRYVGQSQLLRDPKDGARTVLVGEWSPASDPISVTPSTYFFLNSAKPDKSGARVDVYKWRNGAWMKQSFDVTVGDVIGGQVRKKLEETDAEGKPITETIDFSTGATVLDLRFDEQVDVRVRAAKSEFNYRTMPQLVMVYLDPADGQVKERVLESDKSDPVRKKLDEET